MCSLLFLFEVVFLFLCLKITDIISTVYIYTIRTEKKVVINLNFKIMVKIQNVIYFSSKLK